MALNAIEQVATQVPADDFQALEEKVYRTIGCGSKWKIATRNW
jgi:hypothetical protein